MKWISVVHESPVVNFDSIKFYGAVVNAWAHLYPDNLDDFIDSIRCGEVRFSSPLPYFNGHLYLPFPRISLKDAYRLTAERGYSKYPVLEYLKKLRKARYIRDDWLERLHGTSMSVDMAEEIYREYQEEENPPFLMGESESEPRPHVTVNRLDSSSTIFFVEGEKLPGVDADREYRHVVLYSGGMEEEVRGALRFIEDIGISKKVSWGMGKVKFRIENGREIKIESGLGEYHYLLSKYIPTEKERDNINPETSRFDMGVLSGKRRDGRPLPLIHYVSEGALLSSDTPLVGRVIEEEDWLLSGIGFFMGGSK